MIVLTNPDEQTVAPGGTVVLNATLVGNCCNGNNSLITSSIKIGRKSSDGWLISFSGNVGGTTAATPVELSISLGGSPITGTQMISTPAAVGDLNNVSKTIPINNVCCDFSRVTVVNTGTTPIVIGANPILAVAPLGVSC